MAKMSQVIIKSSYILKINDHDHHHHPIIKPTRQRGNPLIYYLWSTDLSKWRSRCYCIFLLTGFQLQWLPWPFYFRCWSTVSYLSKGLLEFSLLPRCEFLSFSLWTSIPSTKRKGRLKMRKHEKKVQKPWRRI